MLFKRFYTLLLLFVFIILISCGGGREKAENKTVGTDNKVLIKIGNYNWYFNNQGLNKAIEKAKQADKLIFAVFSSMW